MSEERSEPRFTISRSSKLEKYGLMATKIYRVVLFGGLPVLGYLGVVKFEQLSLNEVGDFLAGAFGPLALFWLVLGFFQQGDELRNSVEALKLQAEELRNSVDQQKELVEVSRQEIDHERQVKAEEEAKDLAAQIPRINVSAEKIHNGFSSRYEIGLKNTGGDTERIHVSGSPVLGLFKGFIISIECEDSKGLHFSFEEFVAPRNL